MCLLVVLPGCLIPAEFHEGREFYDNAGACVKIILTLFFLCFLRFGNMCIESYDFRVF